MPTEVGFAWSCNYAGPGWEQPDTVTITEAAADSLKNTSVGFASGQPSLSSSSNTVAADRVGAEEAHSSGDLLQYTPPCGSYPVCTLQ